MRTAQCVAAALALAGLAGCASLVSNATSGLAGDLSSAILNQDDPETVRDGAPAFLLMLDGFVQGEADNPAMLGAAAELYAAYGVLFVDDGARATRLTDRAVGYAERGLCASNAAGCNISGRRFDAFGAALDDLGRADVPALYTYALAWFAKIRANAGDMAALSQLPWAEAALGRVATLDPAYREAEVAHYQAVLATLRPPALGGRFDEGRSLYERAIELTGGKDLAVKVDFARYYARTLYERDLHDRLLKEVLAADPVAPNLTLFNVLAQRQAQQLLDTADDHF